LHGGARTGADVAQARCVEQLLAAGFIAYDDANVIPGMSFVAVRRIGRCLSVDDEGGKTELLDSLNLERVAVQWNGMAVDAAVPMLQNFEDGKAGSEILIHGIAAVHLMWTTFSQHQQACG